MSTEIKNVRGKGRIYDPDKDGLRKGDLVVFDRKTRGWVALDHANAIGIIQKRVVPGVVRVPPSRRVDIPFERYIHQPAYYRVFWSDPDKISPMVRACYLIRASRALKQKRNQT